MRRLLAWSLIVTVAALAVGAKALVGATNPRPPLLPNLTVYFAGQHPRPHRLVLRGVVFECFTFLARDGALTECFAVGKAKPAKKATVLAG